MASAGEEAKCFSGSSLMKIASEADTPPSPTNIQIYLRMRPMAGRCEWHSVIGKDGRTLITKLPRDEASAGHNALTEYKFHFDGIFDQGATQEEVFQGVAVPVVDDALRGINGTIFAYGQTGTGKTYTITGDSEAFEMRGIIPRAIARVFESASSCSSAEFTLAVSYLEIYQDRGYDLLVKAEAGGNKLEDLQRVFAVTDHMGQIVLRGLSVHPIRTEEEALSLLFVGDANRIVAETPLNDCSTRSHCIFTIWIANREYGSNSTRRAKLHLVDLAGSERVKQSGTRPGDCVFQEACSINLTLHYLEQVILALHQKAAGQATHIPYRNSLMTSVLKDSLGGNCKTRMIATIALELYAIQETINTCRFAQAVAQVKNVAEINEEEEASATIERLKTENEKLRGQLQLATATREDGLLLTEEGKAMCRNSVEQFLQAPDDALNLPLTAAKDLLSADYCFRVMRDKFKKALAQDADTPCRRQECRDSLMKLQLHVEQRDAEIATLLGILHQSSDLPDGFQAPELTASITRVAVEAAVRGPQHGSLLDGSSWLTGPEATAILKNRGRAFEILRRSARKAELLEADSQRLHRLYNDARTHRDAAATARSKIAQARVDLEKLRVRECLHSKTEDLAEEDTPEETQLLSQVAEWRDEYIRHMESLDAAKRELKRVHLSVERGRKKLQEDFASWFNAIAVTQATATGQAETADSSDAQESGKISQATTQLLATHMENSNKQVKSPGADQACGVPPVSPWLRYPWTTDRMVNRLCSAKLTPPITSALHQSTIFGLSSAEGGLKRDPPSSCDVTKGLHMPLSQNGIFMEVQQKDNADNSASPPLSEAGDASINHHILCSDGTNITRTQALTASASHTEPPDLRLLHREEQLSH
ncbi:hypothetical protein Efla_005731 [Eimeria flavescens]